MANKATLAQYRGTAQRSVAVTVKVTCEYFRTAEKSREEYRRTTTNILNFTNETENIGGSVVLKAGLGEHLSGEVATTWNNTFNDIEKNTNDVETVSKEFVTFADDAIHYGRRMITKITIEGAPVTVREEFVDDAATPAYETAPLTQEELIRRAVNYMESYHGVTDGTPIHEVLKIYNFESDYEISISGDAIDELFVGETSYWQEQREQYNEWSRRWAFEHNTRTLAIINDIINQLGQLQRSPSLYKLDAILRNATQEYDTYRGWYERYGQEHNKRGRDMWRTFKSNLEDLSYHHRYTHWDEHALARIIQISPKL